MLGWFIFLFTKMQTFNGKGHCTGGVHAGYLIQRSVEDGLSLCNQIGG